MSRIQEFLRAIVDKRKETEGLTQQKLSEQIGATPGMVSALLSGERRFNEDWIEKFCDVLGITLGDIEQATPYVPEPRVLREYSDKLKQIYEISPAPAFRSVSRTIDDWLEAMEEKSVAQSKPETERDYIDSELVEEEFRVNYTNSDAPRPVALFRVPHYDAIPAGDPKQMDPEGQMWMDIVHSQGKDTWYTLRIVGDSMSPDYLEGDIVLMDYALQPNNGNIVAALIDGAESTLKIYSRRDDEITLTPIEIQHHSPQKFHAGRIKIQGVLIEIVRRTARRKR